MEELPLKQEQDNIPETLYRGITLKVDDFEKADFSTTLKPGSDEIDEDGNRVVSDGNEYGVYMSTNPRMVKTAYYGKSKEGIKTESFLRSWSWGNETYIPLPSVGILFEIKTEGLDVREPQFKKTLKGVANNGFEGKEYVVEEIPTSNFKVKELCLSSEVYDKEAIIYKIETEKDFENAKKDILTRYKEKKSQMLRFRDEIANLPKEQRRNPRIVGSIYENILKDN